MANTVQKSPNGPFWVLGNIAVATPGTPVPIMGLVDPTLINDPNNPTTPASMEYPPRGQAFLMQGFNQGGLTAIGLRVNTGNVYLIKRGTGAGSGNREDAGVIVAVILPGTQQNLSAAALNLDVFNPYDFYVDADNAGDGLQVTLIVQ